MLLTIYVIFNVILITFQVREEEIDLLKARVRNLETELHAALSKPNGKNHEMIANIKQQHEEVSPILYYYWKRYDSLKSEWLNWPVVDDRKADGETTTTLSRSLLSTGLLFGTPYDASEIGKPFSISGNWWLLIIMLKYYDFWFGNLTETYFNLFITGNSRNEWLTT